VNQPCELLVVGTPRSGTTLVQRLVAEECGLRGGVESHFFTFLMNQGSFRQRNLKKSLARYPSIPQLYGVSANLESIIMSAVSSRRVCLYEVFQRVIMELNGESSHLCEKTPGHLWLWRPLTKHDPFLKLVIVVRDPRAVVASTRKAGFASLTLPLLSELWRIDQRMARVARRVLGPERCLLVRYEDVVLREGSSRAAIAAFAGGQTRDEGVAQQLMLDWEDWKVGYSDQVHSGRLDAWRDDLSTSEASLVSTICRTEMVRLGYPLSSEPAADADSERWRRLRLRLAVRYRTLHARLMPL
jgi:hypothetical protein